MVASRATLPRPFRATYSLRIRSRGPLHEAAATHSELIEVDDSEGALGSFRLDLSPRPAAIAADLEIHGLLAFDTKVLHEEVREKFGIVVGAVPNAADVGHELGRTHARDAQVHASTSRISEREELHAEAIVGDRRKRGHSRTTFIQ